MSYRRQRPARSRKYGASHNAGLEVALRHIEQAKTFSQEIGGTDRDVKEYFFSLERQELERILLEYGKKYGASAELYARSAMLRWKSGATKMSGDVAKRLFDLLPPQMPLKKKYELAENVWRHFGPKSSHSFSVGPEVDINSLAQSVASVLEEEVSNYSLPENLRRRFTWLSSGDIRVKEELLNYFREIEKKIALQKILLELPVLQRHFRDNPTVSRQAKTLIQVHKHEISLRIDPKLGNQFREETPAAFIGAARSSDRAPVVAILLLVIIGTTILAVILGR